ncbi:hypothetical protein HDU98_008652 [Podochytrium sp. JEL0797]|nr:hypothetical protein HDU98_008652 [Podochytrium sp. JEL0797]
MDPPFCNTVHCTHTIQHLGLVIATMCSEFFQEMSPSKRSKLEDYKQELLSLPIGLIPSDRKDVLLHACYEGCEEMLAGEERALPTDASFFKTLAARPGEHPYYQGITMFIAGYVGGAVFKNKSVSVFADFRRGLRIWDSMSPKQL